MKMFSKEGIEMVDVRCIELDGEQLLLKTKVMGSMAATIVLRPPDVWAALKLLSWRLLLRMPVILFMGWRATKVVDRVKT